MSQTQEIWIRNNKRVNPKNKHAKPTGYIFPESLYLCTITPSSVIMGKDLFETYNGFDEKIYFCRTFTSVKRLRKSTAAQMFKAVFQAESAGPAPTRLNSRVEAPASPIRREKTKVGPIRSA